MIPDNALHEAQIEALDDDIVLILSASSNDALFNYMVDNDIDVDDYRSSYTRRLVEVYKA